jgi:hypothetical protein
MAVLPSRLDPAVDLSQVQLGTFGLVVRWMGVLVFAAGLAFVLPQAWALSQSALVLSPPSGSQVVPATVTEVTSSGGVGCAVEVTYTANGQTFTLVSPEAVSLCNEETGNQVSVATPVGFPEQGQVVDENLGLLAQPWFAWSLVLLPLAAFLMVLGFTLARTRRWVFWWRTKRQHRRNTINVADWVDWIPPLDPS